MPVVPLAEAGFGKPDIDHQVTLLCNSETFGRKENLKAILRYIVDKSLLGGRPPRSEEIGELVYNKNQQHKGVQARGDVGRIRGLLFEYYSGRTPEATPVDIVLSVPAPGYVVYASTVRRVGTIDVPKSGMGVMRDVDVSGHVGWLNPDSRLWLVVRVAMGDLYPQTYVSRAYANWHARVQIGRAGAFDVGEEYRVQLVEVDPLGDYAMHHAVQTAQGTIGRRLPERSIVLDAVDVVREADVRTR